MSRFRSLAPLFALAACSSAKPVSDAGSPPAHLALPGDTYYPESVTGTADGALYVGSFGTGAVGRFAPDATSATTFIAPSADVPRALGVLADEAGHALWLCADDTSTTNPIPPSVRRYDLTTGAFVAGYHFPAPAFCNDLALDGHHNLYISDSLGSIYRLADGADHLTQWSHDAALAPLTASGFGANGIAWDGATGLYATNFEANQIVHLAITADGSAGPATALTVSTPLSGPDAVRLLDAHTLLVVEQAGGKLTQIALPDGTASPLATGLAAPTSVTVHASTAWVTEGQLGHILGTVPGPPTLPFDLARVAL